MNNVIDFFKDSAEFLISLLVVSIVVTGILVVQRISKLTTEAYATNVTNYKKQIENQYSNATVSGIDALNTIRLINKQGEKYKYGVKVVQNSSTTEYSKATDYNITLKTDVKYIDPLSQYTSTIEYGTNKAIKNIVFTKS